MQKGDISLWFLGCLLAYPCFEMVEWSLLGPFRATLPFNVGDDHLHNYAYKVLRDLGWHRTLANSVTEVVLGLVSACVPCSLIFLGHGCHQGYHVLAGIFSRVRDDTLCVCSTP